MLTETEKLRREKISKSLKGKKKPPFSEEHKEKLRKNSTGKKMSEKNKQELSERMKGNKYKVGSTMSEENKEKARQRKSNLGKTNKHWIGDKNPRWKGGITDKVMQIRHSLDMKTWRRKVYERDDFTCLMCSQFGVYLNAHHIQTFSKYPDRRFDVDNGITLCVPCHNFTKGKEDDYEERFFDILKKYEQ